MTKRRSAATSAELITLLIGKVRDIPFYILLRSYHVEDPSRSSTVEAEFHGEMSSG